MIRDLQSTTRAVAGPRQVTITPHIAIAPFQDNRFCFNTENPGVLSIECTATTGNPQLDLWLEWSITPIVGSEQNTTYDNDRPGWVSFTFTGLPEDNNQFGPKYTRASLPNYNAQAQTTVFIFYDKTADNHPTPGRPPNWFYYWSFGQVVHDRMGEFLYSDPMEGPEGGGYWDHFLYLCDRASEVQAPQDIAGHSFVPLYGIDATAATIEHELYHKEVDDNWAEGGIWYNAYDGDGDRLPDLYEEQVSGDPDWLFGQNRPLNIHNPDTFDLGSIFHWAPYYYTGDQELLAYLRAEDAQGLHPQLDWSHGEYSKQWPTE